jgi:hypothetical protein
MWQEWSQSILIQMIKRIDSVQMSYNRFALERVGGLEIIYNRRGQVVDIYGSVKAVEGMHITKITIIDLWEVKRS